MEARRFSQRTDGAEWRATTRVLFRYLEGEKSKYGTNKDRPGTDMLTMTAFDGWIT